MRFHSCGVTRYAAMTIAVLMGMQAPWRGAAEDATATVPEIVSLAKIWDAGPQNAFTNLTVLSGTTAFCGSVTTPPAKARAASAWPASACQSRVKTTPISRETVARVALLRGFGCLRLRKGSAQ